MPLESTAAAAHICSDIVVVFDSQQSQPLPHPPALPSLPPPALTSNPSPDPPPDPQTDPPSDPQTDPPPDPLPDPPPVPLTYHQLLAIDMDKGTGSNDSPSVGEGNNLPLDSRPPAVDLLTSEELSAEEGSTAAASPVDAGSPEGAEVAAAIPVDAGSSEGMEAAAAIPVDAGSSEGMEETALAAALEVVDRMLDQLSGWTEEVLGGTDGCSSNLTPHLLVSPLSLSVPPSNMLMSGPLSMMQPADAVAGVDNDAAMTDASQGTMAMAVEAPQCQGVMDSAHHTSPAMAQPANILAVGGPEADWGKVASGSPRSPPATASGRHHLDPSPRSHSGGASRSRSRLLGMGEPAFRQVRSRQPQQGGGSSKAVTAPTAKSPGFPGASAPQLPGPCSTIKQDAATLSRSDIIRQVPPRTSGLVQVALPSGGASKALPAAFNPLGGGTPAPAPAPGGGGKVRGPLGSGGSSSHRVGAPSPMASIIGEVRINEALSGPWSLGVVSTGELMRSFQVPVLLPSSRRPSSSTGRGEESGQWGVVHNGHGSLGPTPVLAAAAAAPRPRAIPESLGAEPSASAPFTGISPLDDPLMNTEFFAPKSLLSLVGKNSYPKAWASEDRGSDDPFEFPSSFPADLQIRGGAASRKPKPALPNNVIRQRVRSEEHRLPTLAADTPITAKAASPRTTIVVPHTGGQSREPALPQSPVAGETAIPGAAGGSGHSRPPLPLGPAAVAHAAAEGGASLGTAGGLGTSWFCRKRKAAGATMANAASLIMVSPRTKGLHPAANSGDDATCRSPAANESLGSKRGTRCGEGEGRRAPTGPEAVARAQNRASTASVASLAVAAGRSAAAMVVTELSASHKSGSHCPPGDLPLAAADAAFNLQPPPSPPSPGSLPGDSTSAGFQPSPLHMVPNEALGSLSVPTARGGKERPQLAVSPVNQPIWTRAAPNQFEGGPFTVHSHEISHTVAACRRPPSTRLSDSATGQPGCPIVKYREGMKLGDMKKGEDSHGPFSLSSFTVTHSMPRSTLLNPSN